MATYNVSSVAQILSAMSAASIGDEIVVASGNYGALNAQDIVKGPIATAYRAPQIPIRPANRSNPPVFNQDRFEWHNVRGFKIDGLWFHGTAVESTKNGVQYPDLREAQRFYECNNISMINCSIKFHLSQTRNTRCSFFEMGWNRWWQCGIDPHMFYGTGSDIWLHDFVIDDPRIDEELNRAPGVGDTRHSDAVQGRCDGTPWQRVIIERGYTYGNELKGIFLVNQGGVAGNGWINSIVRDIDIYSGRNIGLGFGGQSGLDCRRIRVRPLTDKTSDIPRIYIYQPGQSGTIRDIVVPARSGSSNPFQTINGAAVTDFTTANIVMSNTASPPGFPSLVPGTDIGPYTSGTDVEEPTAPPAMSAEWANPPANSVGKDGRVVGPKEVPGQLGRWTGEIVIPAASVAAAAMATNPLTPNAEVTNLQWRRPGVTSWKPTVVADPAQNASGWRRYRMAGGPGGDLDIYSTTAGQTMSDIDLRYSVEGVWSNGSSYTGAFTAPAAPPVEVKPPALTAGQWALDPTPVHVEPGGYTAVVSLVGVTATGVRWHIDGDPTPRPAIALGGGLYQLAPLLPGGGEHVVPYLGTLAIRLSYATDAIYSDPSADAKTFTAPAAPSMPPILSGWSRGDKLRSGSAPIRVCGFPLSIGRPDLPEPPVPDQPGSPAYASEGVLTVTLPASPPPGAVDQLVKYAGRVVAAPRANPVVTFPYIPGEDVVLACGVTDDGEAGVDAVWFVETSGPPPIYVHTTGNDTTGDGSTGAPYATLAKALTMAPAGGSILLKSDITLPDTASYTGITVAAAGLTIASDTPGTKRTLDMSAMKSNSTAGGDGIRFSGAGQTIRDLRFTGYQPTFGGSPSDYVAALNPRGANFLAERCEIDNASGRGMALGEGGTPTGATLRDCDFHDNRDPSSSSPYGNADGLQVFSGPAHTGILVERCRFWNNSDDGVDLFFAQAPLTIQDSWAFRNGYRADGTTLGGDGVGLKIGGGTYTVAHTVTGCLLSHNAGSGLSSNDNQAAHIVQRCTAMNNGAAGNADPAGFILDGSSTATIDQCVKLGGYSNFLGASVTRTRNSWDTPPGLGAETAAWFGANAIAYAGLDDARGGDGSLPVVNDGRPATGSALLTANASGSYIGWTGTALQAAPPVAAAAAIPAQRLQERTGKVTLRASDYFSGATSYSLPGSPPAGVTMPSAALGNVEIDLAVAARQAATSVTVRATNAGESVDQTFALSVGAQRGVSVPTGDLSGLSAANRTAIFDGIAATGALFVRLDFDRNNIETSEGSNTWTLMDDLVQRASQAGLLVLGILKGSPAWAEAAWNVLPSNTTKWATWVTAVANRYPEIKHWQVWNEQNGGFSTTPTSGSSFSPTMVAAFNALKAVDPALTVIYGGLTASSAGDGSGALDFLTNGHTVALSYDAMAIHPYRWNVPAKAWTDADSWFGPEIMRDLYPILNANGGAAKKVWLTEDGGPTGGTDGGSVTPLTQAQQATLALQTWDATCGDSRIGAAITYTYADRGGAADVTENWFGIVGPSPSLTPKTARTTLAGIRQGTGRELVIDGSFAATGPGFRVTYGVASLSIVGGRQRITNGAADWSGATLRVPVRIGVPVTVSAQIVFGTAGGSISVDATGTGSTQYGDGAGTVTRTWSVIPTRNYLEIFIATNTNVSGNYVDFDNISVKEA